MFWINNIKPTSTKKITAEDVADFIDMLLELDEEEAEQIDGLKEVLNGGYCDLEELKGVLRDAGTDIFQVVEYYNEKGEGNGDKV